MPETNSKQAWCTCSVCAIVTKNKEGIEKLKTLGDSRYIFQNNLNKAFFQDDLVFGKFKYLYLHLLIRYYIPKHLIFW